jgi:hypothetical protein
VAASRETFRLLMADSRETFVCVMNLPFGIVSLWITEKAGFELNNISRLYFMKWRPTDSIVQTSISRDLKIVTFEISTNHISVDEK